MLLVTKNSRVHLIKISLTGIYVVLGIVGYIGDTPSLYEEVCHKDSDARLHYDTPQVIVYGHVPKNEVLSTF